MRSRAASNIQVMNLDQALCFALYRASRALTGFYRPLLDELGITYPQYVVLLALWERDGVSVGALGERVSLDYGTLSPLLKRLESAGLIRRVRRTEDERTVTVSLTAAGSELGAAAERIPERVVAATGLGPEEFDELRATLVALTASVTAGGAERAAA